MRIVVTIDKKNTTVNAGMGILLTYTDPECLTVKFGMESKTYVGIPFNSVISVILYDDEGRFSIRRMYPPHNPQKILNAYYRRNVSIVLSNKQKTPIIFDRSTNTATLSGGILVHELHSYLSHNTDKRMQIVNMLLEDVSSLTTKQWLDRFKSVQYKEVD